MAPQKSSLSTSLTSMQMPPSSLIQVQHIKDNNFTNNQQTNNNKRKHELLLEHCDNILTIKINRPHCKNALNRNAVYELISAFGQATHNADIKLVVITGVGDTFCAGNDLKQMMNYENPNNFYLGANYVLKSCVNAILNCPKIVICLINGPCIGIGCTLTALCDIVYCTRQAYFQTPFSQLGLCPEACSSYTFPRTFGPSWSAKLLLFGEKLSAEKAEALGFVAEVFDNQNDMNEKLSMKLLEYSKLPWESMRVAKRLIRLHNSEGLMKALDNELKEIEKLRKGPVYQQAIQMFVEKSLERRNKKSKL